MRILVDTNVLLRLIDPYHPHYSPSLKAFDELSFAGRTFCIGSQTISEFLAVATRARTDRGLGMSQMTADAALSQITSNIEILYDTPQLIIELRRLAVTHSVVGKSVYDARLVAAMNMNGIKDILTFNVRDFERYPINVLDPMQLKIPS